MDATTFQRHVIGLGGAAPKAITLGADYCTMEHAHAYEAHVLVIAGQFIVTTSESRFVMNPGDDLILPANTAHSESVGPAGAQLLVAAIYRD